MRLVNVETKKAIVEFIGKKTLIHNKFLEEEMKILGIPIPDGMRGLFEGRDTIHLDEEKFQEAFKQIYFFSYMDPRHFKWEE